MTILATQLLINITCLSMQSINQQQRDMTGNETIQIKHQNITQLFTITLLLTVPITDSKQDYLAGWAILH